MNSFTHTLLESFSQSTGIGMDGYALAVIGYLLLSWLVCVAAAFLKVKEVHYSMGLIAMGLCLSAAFILGGLCKNYMPGLAESLHPLGLFLYSALAGVLVCSVPLIQYYWDISYWKGLAAILFGAMILMAGLLTFQILANPHDSLAARISIPLLEKIPVNPVN